MMERYGCKNEDLKFGLLEISNDRLDGFGALAKVVWGGLIIMDERGLLPYIDVKSDCYTERYKVNGTFNSFEYFFVQPCEVMLNRPISRREVLQSANVEMVSEEEARRVIDRDNGNRVQNLLKNQELLEHVARLLKKYIRLNEKTAGIYDEIENLFKGRTDVIGLHVRGTAYKCMTPLHPKAVNAIEHLAMLKKIRNGRTAFVCSDEQAVIDMFSTDDEFGKGEVFWYDDVLRTPKEYSDKNISAYCLGNSRKNHKYLLGYEILKEVVTLSYCDSLIAGYSNVSLMAIVIKLSRGEQYSDLCLLENGFWPDEKKYYYGWEYNINQMKMKNCVMNEK